MKDYRSDLQESLTKCFNQMPILDDLCSGDLPEERLPELALVHYAEIKTFINIKNPARLYLCPHDAIRAKKYFCYLYREEQGNFKHGMNHADLFKPACYHVGLDDDELEAFYQRYARAWLYLFHERPSYEILVRELAISVAWESITPFFADKLVGVLRDRYQLNDDALRYFTLHDSVDQKHSVEALDTLTHYCTTPELLQIATGAFHSSLIDELHLRIRRDGPVL